MCSDDNREEAAVEIQLTRGEQKHLLLGGVEPRRPKPEGSGEAEFCAKSARADGYLKRCLVEAFRQTFRQVTFFGGIGLVYLTILPDIHKRSIVKSRILLEHTSDGFNLVGSVAQIIVSYQIDVGRRRLDGIVAVVTQPFLSE